MTRNSTFCNVCVQVIFVVVVPWILLTVALFSNLWIVDDEGKKGLFFKLSNDGNFTVGVLDNAALGLECTCFVLQSIYLVTSIATVCCFGPDNDGEIYNDSSDTCITCCCCCFYCSMNLNVLSSFFSLGVCIRMGILYDVTVFGASFYMTLISFLITWLSVVALLCDLWCRRRDEDHVFKTLLQDVYEEPWDDI